MASVHIIPVLQDNYSYAVHDGRHTAIVDPGDSEPVIAFLETIGWKADSILLTHHHGDHTGGVSELKKRYNSIVVGPASEMARMPNIDVLVSQGSVYKIGPLDVNVIETPGHTSGHIAFWIPAAKALFSGDALFSLGCGRLFEGTASEMWESLQKLAALPGDTNVYCGHEYTAENGRFALGVEPCNAALQSRMKNVADLRGRNEPTVPVTMKTEKETNPFLRSDSAARFAVLRKMKDSF